MSKLPTSSPPEFPEAIYAFAATDLFGIMANWALLGILCVQVYLYYIAFPKDHRILKLIVFAQFLVEIIQTATLSHENFQEFTAVYTSGPEGLIEIGHGVLWIYIALMTALITHIHDFVDFKVTSISQGFYCYRVGVLTRSKYAVALISTLSLGQLALAILVTVQLKRAILLSSVSTQITTLISIGIWGGCSLACDVMIAAIMCYSLWKRDTGFENTHGIVVRLIRLSIETGCVTALSAATILVLVYLPGHPPYYSTGATIAAKIYSNSMMANLNSRIKPVSNAAAALGAPCWNESAQPVGSFSSTERAQGILFRRDSETEFSYSRASGIAPRL